jgi:hypothetical protein
MSDEVVRTKPATDADDVRAVRNVDVLAGTR